MNQPTVAIVILNWNGKAFLQQFLPSVLATDYPQLRVIVADNASTDDSILFLENEFPSVERLTLGKNWGFATGYNKALQQVEARYYVLLNSDVEVTANWLKPMIDLLETNASHAACQPKILAYHRKDHFEYAGAAGGWIDTLGYPFSRGRIFEVCEKDDGQYNHVQPIFWATGAAMVIRSEVFHQLGGFDDYLFAHQEEIDLCWRAQLAGYSVFCCPQSVVYHVGGGTLPRGASRKTFLNFRNNAIIMAKNLPLAESLWKMPLRLVLDWVSALKMLAGGDGGFFKSVIKAHGAFLYWLVFAKKKKAGLRRRSLESLEGVYRGSIVWEHFIKKKDRFSQVVIEEK